MNHFKLSINLLRRDWRAGEWRVLLIALVLAVGSIATVGLFADRVRLALQQEATSLLGADLRVSGTRPLSSAYRAAARQRGLQAIESTLFLSMVGYQQQQIIRLFQLSDRLLTEMMGRQSRPVGWRVPGSMFRKKRSKT